MNPKILIFTTF